MSLRRILRTLQRLILAVYAQRPELQDAMYFVGIALVGYGVLIMDEAAACIVTGALILLTVRPLWMWIR